MKKLVIFFLGFNIFLNAISVQAVNQPPHSKELKVRINADVKSLVHVKMVQPGSHKLITTLALNPILKNPFIYETSQMVSISTFGYDVNRKLKISLLRKLVLTKSLSVDTTPKITDTHVSFQNKELNINHPVEFTPENHKIDGMLKITAKIGENHQARFYGGDLILKIEEIP